MKKEEADRIISEVGAALKESLSRQAAARYITAELASGLLVTGLDSLTKIVNSLVEEELEDA